MKKQLYRAAAATVLGLSLTTGVVAADTGSIDTTGTGSTNDVIAQTVNSTTKVNSNTVSGTNANGQGATTGEANVSDNTDGGDAESGMASNENTVDATVDVDNAAGTMTLPSTPGGNANGSVMHTGTDSTNTVKSDITNTATMTNTNTVVFNNTNSQSASSGTANVSDNTTGGNATSGAASNKVSSTFNFTVSN